MRKPFVEIRQAIWNLDMTLLTVDRLQILLKTIPSDSEMELLSQHASEPSRLGIAEQFCLELMVQSDHYLFLGGSCNQLIKGLPLECS